MSQVLVLTLLVLPAAGAPAPEPKAPVELEATVADDPGGRFGPNLRVRLVGVAKEVGVVTEGLSVRVTRDGKQATVTLTLREAKDDKGRPIIPSADRLGVVRLRAGEVAVVHVPTSPDLRQPLKDALAGQAELVVEYEIAEAWGKRFGVASGKVRGTAAAAR